jgi:hypothetical protein
MLGVTRSLNAHVSGAIIAIGWCCGSTLSSSWQLVYPTRQPDPELHVEAWFRSVGSSSERLAVMVAEQQVWCGLVWFGGCCCGVVLVLRDVQINSALNHQYLRCDNLSLANCVHCSANSCADGR